MKELNKTQKIVFVLYLILSGTIFLIYKESLLSRKDTNMIIFFYGFGTPFVLITSYIRELRNNTNFLIWVGISLVHLYIFYASKNNSYFNIRDYSNQKNWVSFSSHIGNLSTDTLKATFITLISLKVFQILFFRKTGKELTGTFRKFSWYSEEDKRMITGFDVLLNILLYFITLTAVLVKL